MLIAANNLISAGGGGLPSVRPLGGRRTCGSLLSLLPNDTHQCRRKAANAAVRWNNSIHAWVAMASHTGPFAWARLPLAGRRPNSHRWRRFYNDRRRIRVCDTFSDEKPARATGLCHDKLAAITGISGEACRARAKSGDHRPWPCDAGASNEAGTARTRGKVQRDCRPAPWPLSRATRERGGWLGLSSAILSAESLLVDLSCVRCVGLS